MQQRQAKKKQNEEVFNNHVVDFQSYTAKEEKDIFKIENKKKEMFHDGRMLTKGEREVLATS